MTTIATGVFKQLIAKKQSGLGTAASGASAQIYRRVTSTLDLKKATYKSNEIRTSMQRSDFRHGVRSVDGSISGELSVGTYQAPIGSVLRGAWAAVTPYAAGTDVAADAAGTFTDTSAGYLTAGLKVGMVGRWTGWSSTGNNDKNFLITGLTSSVMTGVFLNGDPVITDAGGVSDDVTFTPVGKYCSIPTTGHSRDYWTIEHNFSDITQSEQFVDCVFNTMDIKLPSTGMGTIDFGVIGLDMTTGTSSVFTSPSAVSSGAILAAVNGAVYIQGTAVGQITSLDFQVNGNMSAPGGVVGSNVDPDIFPGMIDVTGNMSVLFDSITMRDYFLNETEVSIVAAFTSGSTGTAAVQTHVFHRVKLGGASKDDGEKGLSLTVPFTALENTAGGTGTNSFATTYWTQDSAAV